MIINMTDKEIESRYTPEEIEAIFRYKQKKYTEEDALFHIEEFIEWHEVTEEEEEKLKSYAEEMAERYLDKFMDCTIAENAVWAGLVEMYYEDKVKGE